MDGHKRSGKDALPLPPGAPDADGRDGPGMPFGVRLERDPNVNSVDRGKPGMPLDIRLECDPNVTVVRRTDEPPGANPFEV